MIAILTLLIIITISLLVNRIATVALAFTGLSRETARFQARVAFTGAGFTTSESELITSHPVRRQIVMMLMLLGNAGLVTVVATLMTGFVNINDDTSLDLAEYSLVVTDDEGNTIPDLNITFEKAIDTDPGHVSWRNIVLGVTPRQQLISRMLALVLGVLGLWTISSSRWVDEQLFKLIGGMLKRFTRLDTQDFSGILRLSEGYTVSPIEVTKDHWLTGRTLMELRLTDEGIHVLGVTRANRKYIGTPSGRTFVRAGDTLIAYGQSSHLDELVTRTNGHDGDAAHGKRVAAHLADRAEAEAEDRSPDRAGHVDSN